MLDIVTKPFYVKSVVRRKMSVSAVTTIVIVSMITTVNKTTMKT